MQSLLTFPEKSSPPQSPTSSDSVILALRRSRKEARHLRGCFHETEGASYLLRGFEIFLSRIETGQAVKFENLLGLIRLLSENE